MSFAESARPNWRASAAGRLGHHASTLLIASVLGTVAVGLVRLPGLLALTVPVSLFALTIATFLMMRQHDRRLCESCAASVPLDAAARAQQLGRRFWAAHAASEPRYLVPYLVVLIGSNFVTGTSVGRMFWAFAQLTMVYLIVAARTHRVLQPWCPWCSGGGGGGGQDVDQTPPVVPHGDRLHT